MMYFDWFSCRLRAGFYIRTDGTTTHPRLLGEVGAHVKGLNHCSIGICYEGGLDPDGHPADTRTPRQRERLEPWLQARLESQGS